MQINPMVWPHTPYGCLKMDTSWQQETWSALNHLTPVIPELSEEKHIVQNRDEFKGLCLAYFPQRTKPTKSVVNIVNNLFS